MYDDWPLLRENETPEDLLRGVREAGAYYYDPGDGGMLAQSGISETDASLTRARAESTLSGTNARPSSSSALHRLREAIADLRADGFSIEHIRDGVDEALGAARLPRETAVSAARARRAAA